MIAPLPELDPCLVAWNDQMVAKDGERKWTRWQSSAQTQHIAVLINDDANRGERSEAEQEEQSVQNCCRVQYRRYVELISYCMSAGASPAPDLMAAGEE